MLVSTCSPHAQFRSVVGEWEQVRGLWLVVGVSAVDVDGRPRGCRDDDDDDDCDAGDDSSGDFLLHNDAGVDRSTSTLSLIHI